MKKIFGFVGAALLALTLTGCVGEMVEVPPASKGIVLGANGNPDAKGTGAVDSGNSFHSWYLK